MFHRLVVILTILAVIACPMFCGKGTACCLDEHLTQAVCDSTPDTCSCCCHEREQPRETPGEVPESPEETCQGICGGVVMLESVKLDTRDELFHAVPFEVVAVENHPDVICIERSDEFASGEEDSGRSLRAMISSYLC